VNTVLARRNPVAKLAAVTVLSLGLLASVDPVTPAVALAVELAVVPLFGLGFGTLVRRGWPLLASVTGIAVTQVLFGTAGGRVVVAAGPLVVTSGELLTAAALALRVLAVALPSVLVFASTDPTDLADSLVQQARVPARFAIGALAAWRMLPLLADEWRLLVLARRARGIDAGRNPVARVRLGASALFALLVGAIRRGTRLATAMDARGFDAGVPRSIARPQRFGRADAALIAGGLAVAVLALAVSVGTGWFRPLF
jgi:energy-coupling factor transport system permease protein